MAQATLTHPTTSTSHLNVLGIGVLVIAVALIAGAAGFLIRQNQIPTNPDSALVNQISTVWSNGNDQGAMASLYASDAIFHDQTTNGAAVGLQAIQWYIGKSAASGTIVTPISDPVRSGDFVSYWVRVQNGATSADMLTAYELNKDGKIQNQ